MKLKKRKLIDSVRQGRQQWCMASRGRVQMRWLLLVVLAVFIAMVSAGCNSGGDSTPQTNTFSGTVMAPGGAVAYLQKPTLANTALALLFGEELQAAVTGMTGLSDATVELIGKGNYKKAQIYYERYLKVSEYLVIEFHEELERELRDNEEKEQSTRDEQRRRKRHGCVNISLFMGVEPRSYEHPYLVEDPGR